jgi:hypothetical protein
MTAGRRIGVLSFSGCALVAAALLTSRALRPSEPVAIHVTGAVQDEGGTPVVGARVRLVCYSAEARQPMKECPARVCEVLSDSRGSFDFGCEASRECGDCELSAIKLGFSSMARVRFPKGQAEPVVIVLRPKAT